MTPRSILLIHPPVSKPCEAPAGPAKLALALRSRGVDCRVYDAGLDGLLGLLERPLTARDKWTRRALAHRQANVAALRSARLYSNRDRYQRAVMDLNRAVQAAGNPFNTSLSLSNYGAPDLSPVRSRDLIRSAEHFEFNPFFGVFSEHLAALFEQRQPGVIGVSINFMSQALCAFAMIGFIRRQLPRATIVCGGGLVTSWMTIPDIGNPFAGLVDELVAGPGEKRLIALCSGDRSSAVGLTGADFSTADLDRYLSPLRVLPYAASRGCYWKKCAFCPETAEDAPYRSANPGTILADLRQAVHQTSAGLVHFLDNALSPRLLEHLGAHPPGAPWYGFARVTPHLADPGFVMDLKKSGCRMLKLGLESGDQRVLDALHKGTSVHTAAQALEALHRAGITTYAYLLFGTPAEDETSALKTLDFTLRHAACIDFLNLAIFNLPAAGREAASLDTGDFYKGDLSLYREFTHPRGWGRSRVRHFLNHVFKKPAAIRAILNHDPPFFTSNHAPFMPPQRGLQPVGSPGRHQVYRRARISKG